MAKEIELKLRLAPESTEQLAEWLDQHATRGRASKLLNDYYDTPDLALARLRAALRIRTSEDGYEQTLKTRRASEAAVQVRNEWNWHLRDNALNHDLLRSGKVGSSWPEDADISELEVVFSTNFHRRRWIWKQDDVDVEVVIDQGEIHAGDRSQPLCETELEVFAGQAESLWVLLEQMQTQAALWLSDVSKAERGYRLYENDERLLNQKHSESASMIDHVFDFQRACEQVIWNNGHATEVWLCGYPLWSLLSADQRVPLTCLLRSVLSDTPEAMQQSVELAADLTTTSRLLAELGTESQLSSLTNDEHALRLVEARRQVADMIECIHTDTKNISELLILLRD